MIHHPWLFIFSQFVQETYSLAGLQTPTLSQCSDWKTRLIPILKSPVPGVTIARSGHTLRSTSLLYQALGLPKDHMQWDSYYGGEDRRNQGRDARPDSHMETEGVQQGTMLLL